MNKVKKELIEWLKSLVIAWIVVMGISIFIAPTTVYGISMNPTLVEKDVLILQKTDVFERGDIVSFESDLVLSESDLAKLNPVQRVMAMKSANKTLIKRVIGLPGDSILIENQQVFVNGQLLDEPYIGSTTLNTLYVEEIPENEYFLMGDNRQHSTDSREPFIGTVSADRIVGKSLVRILPMSNAGKVD